MIVFYIDESGTGLRQRNTPFFVLAAIGLPIDAWRLLDDGVAEIKKRLLSWAKPEDFELKGRDLRRGEKLFRGLSWQERAEGFQTIAQMVGSLPCRIFAVRVDKRNLPATVGSEMDMYRLAFWRLLELLQAELERSGKTGLLMMDARSDFHSSVQDRRVIDAYRDWVTSRAKMPQLVELPWFGFSEFYGGLQLADFCAYLIDFISNESSQGLERLGHRELQDAYSHLRNKICLAGIP